MDKIQTKGRYYSVTLRSGDVYSRFIREPEALDAIRVARPGEWVWFNDTDGVIWVRAEDVQSITSAAVP